VILSRLERAPSDILKDFLKRAFDTYNSYEARYSVFVISFCARSDDLHLWRAYAEGGKGYSIGFQTGVSTPK
jgi:hypothetical protein